MGTTLQTLDVTTIIGSDTFPVNANDVYGLVETIAAQNIRAVNSSNRIEDAFYDYEVNEGTVIEEAIVEMADKQAFIKNGAPDLSPKDPSLKVKYFNNWEAKQFQTTIRKSDIKKILSSKSVTGLEEVISIILDTLTEGEGYDDYKAMRDTIKNEAVGTDAKPLFGGKVAKNMKGVIYEIRYCYNVLKATNKEGGTPVEHATPIDDIRIAISEDVLDLIDIVELANVFNLEKEQLMGKLVVMPNDKVNNANKILIYDRKALGRGTRLYEYSQDVIGKGLYSNHYLTTERCYFFNNLYKALKLDVSKAVESAKAELLVAEA